MSADAQAAPESITVFGDNNSYEYTASNSAQMIFHKGQAVQPEWEVYKQYDNDFPYGSKKDDSVGDHFSWLKWQTILSGAYIIRNGDLRDGLEAYNHYCEGSGEDLHIDYGKAYMEDSSIHRAVNGYLNDTKAAVDQMIAQGQRAPFSITSELLPIGTHGDYPSTENWQKAIGGHKIWISADISHGENGDINMHAVVHELDRYNFNLGAKDIASGAEDVEMEDLKN